MTRRGRVLLCLVLAVVGVTFAPAVGYDFVYDDHPVIVDNPTLTDPMQILRGFGENVWAFSPQDTRPIYYRPVFMAWVTAHRLLFGVNPAPWHASTLLLHLLATAVLFGVVRRLGAGEWVAAAASLLWAVHPTRVESVAWVLGNTDPMAAVLGFGAVGLWLGDKRGLALGAFGGALLCKETSLGFAALPVLLALCGPGAWRERFREAARTMAPWAAVVVGYFVVRHQVMGALAPVFTETDPGTTGRTVTALVGLYAKKLLIPGTSTLLYPVGPVASASDPIFAEGLPWAILALAAGGFLVSRGGPVAALTVGGLVFLLPVLRVRGLQADAFFQDRYLYLPSACLIPALCWTVADLFGRMQPRRGDGSSFVQTRLPALLAGLLVLMSVWGTRRNLPAWQNDTTLWSRALEVHPTASRALFNLAVLAENRGELDAARDLYRRAAMGEPPRALGAFRAAVIDAEAGALDDARVGFSTAVRMRPDDPMFLYESARIEAHFGALDAAEILLDRAGVLLDEGAPAGRGVTSEVIAAELARVRARRSRAGSPPPRTPE